MDRKTLFSWMIFALITIFSVVVIWPPMPVRDATGSIVRQGKIRLGLDLQGGTSFTVQIDQEELRRILREKMLAARNNVGEIPEADLDVEVERALKDADGRVLEVLRNRVDKLGVNEPVIAAGKDHRITIQLPGADQKQREDAEELIKSAAFLQFRLVHKNNSEMVRKLFGTAVKAPEGFRLSPEGDNCYEPLSVDKLKELRKDPGYSRRLGMFEVSDPAYEFMLEKEFVKEAGGKARRIVYRPYFVRRKAEMTGETLSRAHEELDTMTGGHQISITLKRAGGERMAYLFNEFAGRHMAIVLDNTLYSAPVLNEKRERISGVMSGCVISGAFTLEEARRLRDVLNCGTLPAPVKIIQRNIVGASLGENAIHSGVRAAIIGCVFVILFMLVYYMYCGLVANIALLTDIILLPTGMLLTAGILSVFDRSGGGGGGSILQLPVLTMPGIAGIVLTIGMAVDANVLIFERMREEFLAGKSLRVAIAAGYDRAFSAIFDSNVCAILTGVILFIFGSGPVRGYAITLVAGIIVSMYTALVLTRLIFDATASETRTTAFKMMRWIKETTIDFMGPRKIVFLFSTAVIVITFTIFAFRLMDDPKRVLAVDFTGGTTLTYAFQQKADLETVKKATDAAGVPDALAQYQTALDGSDSMLQIKTSQVTDKNRDVGKLVEAELRKCVPAGGFNLLGEEGIGRQVSADLARAGMYAILFSLVGMLIYLTIRFEFGFALGAIVSLFHDALFTLGVYCIFDRQVSLTIVAALLTIIGYSVNDTIVIMDRIRENLKLDPRRSFVEICNLSINQTLARTVLTHVTVTLVTLALFIFGGGAINDFAFCMLIGMVVGIYSTVYVATPVTLAWHRGRRPVMGAPVVKK
ncbi:MAG: protein translocase subunit SecD [bacterium]